MVGEGGDAASWRGAGVCGEYKLYHEAIELYAVEGGSRLRDAYDLFGEYLLTRRKFDDAGTCFQLAGKTRSVRSLPTECQLGRSDPAGLHRKLPAAEIVALAKGLVDELESSRRYTEAARVCLDYDAMSNTP